MSKKGKGLMDSQKTIFIKLLRSKGTVNTFAFYEHGTREDNGLKYNNLASSVLWSGSEEN